MIVTLHMKVEMLRNRIRKKGRNMRKRNLIIAVITLMMIGVCGSAIAQTSSIEIADYTYTLKNTGTDWGGEYSSELVKHNGPNSRAVNNMEYSSGGPYTVLFRVHSKNGLRWFPATNEVWNYCDRKLFTWNSGFGDLGYKYRMEARRNTKETKESITITGSWSPDDKNNP